MSEKLSERFAARYAEGGMGALYSLVEQNIDAILSALRLAEQPPTDAAGMRERAAAKANILHPEAVFKWQEKNDIARGYDAGARKQATFARDAILALPPSPTTDALRVAELEHARICELEETADGANGDGPFTRGAARDALAAIRKTKEG